MTPGYVAALDQGTTSTRCVVFDRAGRAVASAQHPHRQITPRPGWVEHDADELLASSRTCIAEALAAAGAGAGDVAAIGIANQRETVVLWERETGRPLANAIVWQDARSADRVAALGALDRFRDQTGLPLATYFSGPKLSWLLDELPGARARAEAGELAAGTVDSWLAWHLAGVHVTDATNASRTLLMDIHTLAWDDALLDSIGVPRPLLATIGPSSGVVGEVDGIPLAALLGDQQSALFGQCCFAAGEAKCTYGTGNFLLVNTGERAVPSAHGLITGVAYRLGDEPAAYMLEGAVAVTGALVQWLRDKLGLISAAAEIEELAASVPGTDGCVIVPAFSGLFAPRWRPDARGVICGLTQFHSKAHIARAALEATAYATRELVDAMVADARVELATLRVDGGMTANDLLLQIQADVLGRPVVRPAQIETTVLGAAYAAGLAVGFWSSLDELRAIERGERAWQPRSSATERERGYALWNAAVERALAWPQAVL
ncbi:MAG: glycerol kinase [Gaiellales bacterium]|jgi:glycerol kinase|nr:glycerol kinase [Gaiellales bacterium]